MAVRCSLRDAASGEALDDALVTRFVGPHSFTGEDVVEISTHGGRVVPLTVLAAYLRAVARQAGPGELRVRPLTVAPVVAVLSIPNSLGIPAS